MCSAYSESTFWQGLLRLRLVPALGVDFFLFLSRFYFYTACERPLSVVPESSLMEAAASCENLEPTKEAEKQPWELRSCVQKSKASLVTALPRRFSVAPHAVSPREFMNLLHPTFLVPK